MATNPIDFWKTQSTFRKIKFIALQIHSAFGSAVDTERLWKPASRTLGGTRGRLEHDLGGKQTWLMEIDKAAKRYGLEDVLGLEALL